MLEKRRKFRAKRKSKLDIGKKIKEEKKEIVGRTEQKYDEVIEKRESC